MEQQCNDNANIYECFSLTFIKAETRKNPSVLIFCWQQQIYKDCHYEYGKMLEKKNHKNVTEQLPNNTFFFVLWTLNPGRKCSQLMLMFEYMCVC